MSVYVFSLYHPTPVTSSVIHRTIWLCPQISSSLRPPHSATVTDISSWSQISLFCYVVCPLLFLASGWTQCPSPLHESLDIHTILAQSRLKVNWLGEMNRYSIKSVTVFLWWWGKVHSCAQILFLQPWACSFHSVMQIPSGMHKKSGRWQHTFTSTPPHPLFYTMETLYFCNCNSLFNYFRSIECKSPAYIMSKRINHSWWRVHFILVDGQHSWPVWSNFRGVGESRGDGDSGRMRRKRKEEVLREKAGEERMEAKEAQLFPRTIWNVDLSAVWEEQKIPTWCFSLTSIDFTSFFRQEINIIMSVWCTACLLACSLLMQNQ